MRSGGSMKFENRDVILGRISWSWKRDFNFDFGWLGMGFLLFFEVKLWLIIKQYDFKELFVLFLKCKMIVFCNVFYRILIIFLK